MPSIAHTFFSEEARNAIDRAVGEAETNTSGEIVPVLAGAAASYDRALFLCGIWGALLATLAVLAGWCVWVFANPAEGALAWGDQGTVSEGGSLVLHVLGAPLYVLFPAQVAGFLAGFFLARGWPTLHRAFVPHDEMADRVRQAAHEAFHLFRLTDTRHATGIMIYVSLFERMVVVLADKAIDEKFGQEAWDRVRDLVIEGFQTNHPDQGFTDAIAECGRILAEHFPRQTDNTNELPNHLRIV